MNALAANSCMLLSFGVQNQDEAAEAEAEAEAKGERSRRSVCMMMKCIIKIITLNVQSPIAMRFTTYLIE